MSKESALHLSDRFSGAVVGATIGDALSLPYQHYSREFLTSLTTELTAEYRKHHTGFFPNGQYSDDAQVMLAILDAAVLQTPESLRNGLEISLVLRHILPLWRDQLLIERDASCAQAMTRLLANDRQWPPQPHGDGRAEVAPVGRVLSVALLFHARGETLQKQVEELVTFTHTDRRPLACAAAFAAAVASNVQTQDLILGSILDAMASAAARYDPRVGEVLLDFPRILSLTEYRAAHYFENVYPDEAFPIDEDGLGDYCVPALLFALYYFFRTPHSYEDTVRNCLRIGGKNDTTVFLAGALSGSLVGLQSLPKHLLKGVLGSEALVRQSEELYRHWRLVTAE